MLIELVKKNRSYRGFDESVSVSKETLRELTELARFTASGANLQPLKYRLVFEKNEVDALNGMTRWAKMLKNITLPHEGMYPTAYIAVCVDTTLCANPDAPATDIGIAAQTILLGAVEKGLGGCMLGNYEKSEVVNILGLKEQYVPKLLIALGKPRENVMIVDAKDGKTAYYRDENDTHFVPKRTLEDLII
jgi:nitroreductase